MLGPTTKGEGKDVLPDILDTYVEALDLHWMDMLGYALAAIAGDSAGVEPAWR